MTTGLKQEVDVMIHSKNVNPGHSLSEATDLFQAHINTLITEAKNKTGGIVGSIESEFIRVIGAKGSFK